MKKFSDYDDDLEYLCELATNELVDYLNYSKSDAVQLIERYVHMYFDEQLSQTLPIKTMDEDDLHHGGPVSLAKVAHYSFTLKKSSDSSKYQEWLWSLNKKIGSLRSDSKILAVTFMSDIDALNYIKFLEEKGLKHIDNEQSAVDLLLLDQAGRYSAKCAWLTCGDSILDNNPEKSVLACSLKGDEDSQVFFPEGWEYETSLTKNAGLQMPN